MNPYFFYSNPMKITPFNKFHQSLGAKMVPFAGYLMPVEYNGITDEHLFVRSSCGLFDVSHMGTVWVKGPNALATLQWLTTNDVSALTPGKAQYSCFPNGKGGIVDDLLVYKYDEQKYFLVINASNIEKDWNWMLANNKFGAELENSSDKIAQLALQGPRAAEILQLLTSDNVASMKSFTFKEITLAGVSNVIVSTTGYTGEHGYEIYFYKEHAETIWNALFNAGGELLRPVGLGARDTLRLEMGYNLYGNDIDDTTSPIEAGLAWVTKFTDTKDFIDKALLKKQKEQGPERCLVGFELIDRGIPRHYYVIEDEIGNNIGVVTSGTMSPSLKKAIGMGYVKSKFSKPGSEIFIRIRDRAIKAKIVNKPFLIK